MLKVNTYSLSGKKTGDTSLPKEFETANVNLVAQAVRVYEERSHVGLRNTKTRSEVARTTKKVYKQKGTGGARHGSRRANLFVGGGIIFGPRTERRVLKISKGMSLKSRFAAFNFKAAQGEVVVTEDLGKIKKTKDAGALVKSLRKEEKANKVVVILSEENRLVYRFLRNIEGVTPLFYKEVTAFEIIGTGLVVLDQSIFGTTKEKKAVKTAKKEVKK